MPFMSPLTRESDHNSGLQAVDQFSQQETKRYGTCYFCNFQEVLQRNTRITQGKVFFTI